MTDILDELQWRGLVAQTTDEAALRQALGIGPFVALGHSVGGGMAVEAGAAWPDDCVAVVTIAAQASADRRVRDGISAAEAAFGFAAVLGAAGAALGAASATVAAGVGLATGFAAGAFAAAGAVAGSAGCTTLPPVQTRAALRISSTKKTVP